MLIVTSVSGIKTFRRGRFIAAWGISDVDSAEGGNGAFLVESSGTVWWSLWEGIVSISIAQDVE